MQNLAQAAYGYNPAAAAMSVPTTATQFQQKAAYGSSYGNYDAIGQPGGAGKDFASSYSATNAVAAAAAAAAKKPGSSSGTGQGQLCSSLTRGQLFLHCPNSTCISRCKQDTLTVLHLNCR